MGEKKKPSKKWRLTTLNLIGILTLLFLVVLVILLYFIDDNPLPNDSEQKIRVEIIKGLVSVLLATIIGGTVAALFKAHERNVEQSKIQTQVKLKFVDRIGELYRLIKKLRRKLREEGIKMNEKLKLELTEKQYKFYANQMDVLNDVQLEIEGFKIAVENNYLFPDFKQITEHLERMEVYLNKIHEEFEKQNPKIELSEKIDMNPFDFLKEFTFSAKNEYLTREFISKNGLNKYEPKGPKGETHYCFKYIFSNSYGKLLKELS